MATEEVNPKNDIAQVKTKLRADLQAMGVSCMLVAYETGGTLMPHPDAEMTTGAPIIKPIQFLNNSGERMIASDEIYEKTKELVGWVLEPALYSAFIIWELNSDRLSHARTADSEDGESVDELETIGWPDYLMESRSQNDDPVDSPRSAG